MFVLVHFQFFDRKILTAIAIYQYFIIEKSTKISGVVCGIFYLDFLSFVVYDVMQEGLCFSLTVRCCGIEAG